jgi:hypothetical protein
MGTTRAQSHANMSDNNEEVPNQPSGPALIDALNNHSISDQFYQRYKLLQLETSLFKLYSRMTPTFTANIMDLATKTTEALFCQRRGAVSFWRHQIGSKPGQPI